MTELTAQQHVYLHAKLFKALFLFLYFLILVDIYYI